MHGVYGISVVYLCLHIHDQSVIILYITILPYSYVAIWDVYKTEVTSVHINTTTSDILLPIYYIASYYCLDIALANQPIYQICFRITMSDGSISHKVMFILAVTIIIIIIIMY